MSASQFLSLHTAKMSCLLHTFSRSHFHLFFISQLFAILWPLLTFGGPISLHPIFRQSIQLSCSAQVSLFMAFMACRNVLVLILQPNSKVCPLFFFLEVLEAQIERLSDLQFENVWECVPVCVCMMIQTQGFSYRQQIRRAMEQRASNLNLHHNPCWTSTSQPIIFSLFFF